MKQLVKSRVAMDVIDGMASNKIASPIIASSIILSGADYHFSLFLFLVVPNWRARTAEAFELPMMHFRIELSIYSELST